MSKKKEKLVEAIKELDKADKNFLSEPKEVSEYRSKESFKDLFEETSKKGLQQWDLVKGRIIDRIKDYVLVDIGYKSEGLIPISEFRVGPQKDVDIEIGKEIEVLIDSLEDENGIVILSKEKADVLKVWDDIERASENKEVIEGKIIDRVKGGLSVDIGVKAFLPGSQMDVSYMKSTKTLIGQVLKFKIIKFNKKRGNIVLSRKALNETLDVEGKSDSSFQVVETTLNIGNLKEGDLIKGRVKNITTYGVFLDLGGVDGLLHITDLSWKRIKHPSEIVNVGQDLEVKVLRIDHDLKRINLGLKQMQEDPWKAIVEKYTEGKKVKGKIARITDYGAFVELEKGVEGLIHVTEISWFRKHKKPNQVFKLEEEVEVAILESSLEHRRISLSLKQLEESPWFQLKKELPPGHVVEGKVKALTDFGMFVEIKESIEGLVHVSDFSWEKRIERPRDFYKVGDIVKAVVLSLDVAQEKISLGIKQLDQDPWKDVAERFPIGHQGEVKIVKITSFGVFVELDKNIEGLIHISELSTKRIGNPEDEFKVGDILKAEVVSLDTGFRKIGLSAKIIALRKSNQGI